MKKSSAFIIILVLLVTIEHYASGFQCYECKMSPKQDCLKKLGPNKACKKKYCITVREQTLADGKIVNFQRTCEMKPVYTNAIIINGLTQTQTYYYACDRDLCNNGDGIVNIERPPPKNVIIVPGVESSATTLFPAMIRIIFNLSIFPLVVLYLQ